MAVLLLLASPVGAATVTHAPFPGVVSKIAFTSGSGCQSLAGSAKFSMTSGLASDSSRASAKSCPARLGGVGESSFASDTVGDDLGIHLRSPGGSHSIAALWSFHLVGKGSELVAGACPTPVPFSNSYTYQAGSYVYWFNDTGASQQCDANTQVVVSLFTYMEDLTGVNSANYSSVYVIDNSFDTYNSTYWDCYNYTVYNGSAFSYTTGCSGYNTTTQTTAAFGGSYYSGWTGPTSFNNTTVLAPTFWYNNTYVASHHYLLYVELEAQTYAQVIGWSHATASASVNMATSGNFGQLLKIVET